MSILVTRKQTLNHIGGYPSTAVGYLNPVWYKFIQYTGEWDTIESLAAGQVRLQLSSSVGVVDLVVGGTLRFASGTDGIYSGLDVGVIVAINLVGTNTVDLSGVTYRGLSSGGYWTNLTKYKNLRIETRLQDFNGNTISKARSTWYAQPNHFALVDLSSELKSLFYEREHLPYNSDYQYLSAKQYILQYRERFIGDLIVDDETGWLTTSELILASPSRKQIKEQYGNNLLDYSLKPPGVASAGGVANNFANFNFEGTLAPWLKTTETPTDLYSNWFWSPANGGAANCAIDNLLYQSVGVTAGSRRLRFQIQTGAFFVANYEVWAFDDPATYLSTGDLILSASQAISSLIAYDSNYTFPTNRQYVGWRFSNGISFCDFTLHYFLFGNALTAIINAPPGKFLERQSLPIMYSHTVESMSPLINPDFLVSALPWKTTPNIAGRNWYWSAGTGGVGIMFLPNAAPIDAASPFLYQEVNAKPGGVFRMVIKAAQFPLLGGDLMFEIWAFDDPDNVEATGTLLEGISNFGTSVPADFTKFITIREGAKYLGFRTNHGDQSDVSLDSVTIFQPILAKPISYIIDHKGVELMFPSFDLHADWQNVNGVLLSHEVKTVSFPDVGVFATNIEESPAGSKYVSVWATMTGDPTKIVATPTRYKIMPLCEPYILLEYQNSLGGFSQHAFMIRHNVNLQPSIDKPITSIYEYDIENSEGNLFKDGTDWKSEITMYDDFILTSDLVWVAEIKTSKQVRILFPNGASIFCVVSSTDTSWITGTKYSKIVVTVRIPDNFNPLLINPELV